MKVSDDQPERLQKAMARLGIASRRHAEKLISKGLVKVNGQIVTQMGLKVTDSDLIEVNDDQVMMAEKEGPIYILLNKPEGIISSVTDPQKRKTVIDIIRNEVKERVYPVGRLDYDTSGLILLTNDGELTYRLTHPSYGIEKTYRAWIKGIIPEHALHILAAGVMLEDGLTSSAKINIVKNDNKGNKLSVVEITIHEGKNRQVRRMFEQVGYPLVYLQRISFGPLTLEEKMQAGEYRFLLKNEIAALKAAVGII